MPAGPMLQSDLKVERPDGPVCRTCVCVWSQSAYASIRLGGAFGFWGRALQGAHHLYHW